MNEFSYDTIMYLVQVSIILATLGAVFYVLFRKLTFYYINRVLLLLIVMCSFVIPALKVDLHQQNPFVQAVLLPIDNGERIATPTPTPAHYDGTNDQVRHSQLPEKVTAGRTNDRFSWQAGLFAIYIAVVILMLYRLAKSIRALWLLKAAGELHREGAFTYIHCDVKQPFSFFKWIFFDPTQLDQQSTSIILTHEVTHSNHYHSFDVLLFEMVKCILWFNPFVYILARQSRLINEYYVDHQVKEQTGRHAYIDTLLAQVGIPSVSKPISYFTQAPLKDRIIQLMKQPSNTVTKYRYILYIPIIASFSLLFSFDLNRDSTTSRKLKSVVARLHDESGYQAQRNGEVLIDLPFEDYKPNHFSKNIHAINKLQRLLWYIPLGEVVSILQHGNDWGKISSTYFQDVRNTYYNIKAFDAIDSLISKFPDSKTGKPHYYFYDNKGRIKTVYTPPSFSAHDSKFIAAINDPSKSKEEVDLIARQTSYRKTLELQYDAYDRPVQSISPHKKHNFGYDQYNRLNAIDVFGIGNTKNAYKILYDQYGEIEKVLVLNVDGNLEYSVNYKYEYY